MSVSSESSKGVVTDEESEILVSAAVEVEVSRILAEVNAKLDTIRELHTEDLFRGHLSNGCRTCGPIGDLGYPCPTIIAIDGVS